MMKLILNELLKLDGEQIISNRELRKYKHYKKRCLDNKRREEKTKYIYQIVKPILNLVERQNIDAINRYLEDCVPLRNLFLDF